MNLIATCFNFAIPGQVAGEFVRYSLIGKGNNGKRETGITIVLADRILGLICLAILAFAFWLSISTTEEYSLFWGLGIHILISLLVGILIWVLISYFPMGSRNHDLGWKKIINSFVRPLAGQNPTFIFGLLTYSLIFHLFATCVTWQSANAVGVNLPFIQWAFLYSLASLAVTLPVAVGGFGVREGVFVTYLSHLNVSMESALAISLLVFLINAFLALIGGLLYVTRH